MTDGLLARLLASTAALALLVVSGPSVGQSPQGPTIAAGTVVVTRQGATTVVTQTTDKGIIDWRSFSIGSHEAVRFDQPGRSSVTLNRVTGSDASRIDGSLSASGQVWLSNPNGVLIGPGGRINAAGLLATTGRIDGPEFLRSGAARIDQIAPDAVVRNAGAITIADGGYAALAAAAIRNDGVIAARAGRVAIGAGNAMTLDFTGDRLIQFQVTQALDHAPAGAEAAIVNAGKIAAEGGTVLLSARAAKGVMDSVINMTGHILSDTVRIDGGTVIFGDGGSVQVSGRIDATSVSDKGGSVSLLGEKVALLDGALIDASGLQGGGTVLIGGDWRGKGEGRNAASAFVSERARITVDAGVRGDGGMVVVWADDTTRFDGTITARGGALSGNGGKIETSGKSVLKIGPNAKVDAGAAAGRVGGWLLDPATLLVANSGGDVTPATINAATADFTLNATGSVTIADTVAMTVSGVGMVIQTDTAFINAPISTNDGGFTLRDAAGTGAAAQATFGAAGAISTGAGTIDLSAATIKLQGSLIGASIGLTGGSVILTGDATITSPSSGAISFAGTINATSAGGQSLDVSSVGGQVSFAGSIGATTPLSSLIASGVVTISPANAMIVTVGDQSYPDSVLVPNGVTFQSSSGGVTFKSLDGPGDVTISTQTGTVFKDHVGQNDNAALTNPLASLTITGPTRFQDSADEVRTVGTQSYGGAVVLANTAGPTMSFFAEAAPVTFGGTVDALTSGVQSIATQSGGAPTPSAMVFKGNVGGTTPLAALDISGLALGIPIAASFTGNLTVAGAINIAGSASLSGAASSQSLTIGGPSSIGGSVATVDSQQYGGDIALTATTTFSSQNSSIAVSGAVNSQGSPKSVYFVANGAGGQVFATAIGDSGPLDLFSISQTADVITTVTTNNFARVAINTPGNAKVTTSANPYALEASSVGGTMELTALGQVTQNGPLRAPNLVLTNRDAAAFALTDAGNVIGTVAGAAASLSLTNGNSGGLTVGAVDQASGLSVTGALTLTQLGSQDLMIDQPITAGAAVFVSGGQLKAPTASVAVGTGPIEVSANGGVLAAVTVNGASGPVNQDFLRVLSGSIVVNEATVTAPPPLSAPEPSAPSVTIASTPSVVSSPTLASTPSVGTVVGPPTAPPSPIGSVPVQTPTQPETPAPSSPLLLPSLLANTGPAAQLFKDSPTLLNQIIFPTAFAGGSLVSLPSSDSLTPSNQIVSVRDAVSTTPSGALIPSFGSSVSGTGAALAATPTVKVDPADTGGGGGQVIAAFGSVGVSRTLLPGLLIESTVMPGRRRDEDDPLLSQQPSQINEEYLLD